jgi:redox-sensitive bicupin YhaK (pirin superfamily)
MIKIRKANERGHTAIGWLDSYHTFSFGDYGDPENDGFRSLRVINQDRVEPGQGFGTHGHRDMEIISYVLEGELEHKDSMGTGSIIRPGDVQRMSAGTGVRHSESNPSKTNPVRFLQIWLFPDKDGLKPSYEQKNFPDSQKRGRLLQVASPDGKDGSISIHQDAHLYSTLLEPGESVTYENKKERHAWMQMARGKALLNGKPLEMGDGAAVSGKESLKIEGKESAEILLFDLA